MHIKKYCARDTKNKPRKEVFCKIMAYLMDLTADQRKQEKTGAGKLVLGIGIGSILGLGIGIMIAPKSGRETMNDIRTSIMNSTGMQAGTGNGAFGNTNYGDLGSQATEFAQDYGASENQGNNSRAGSFDGISQGNSVIGNMNTAGKITKIFASNGAGINAAEKTGGSRPEKSYGQAGSPSSIGTIFSMDNSSYNDAIDESNYTKSQNGGTGNLGGGSASDTEIAQDYSMDNGGSRPGVSGKVSGESYGASLNYGASNIQASSNREKGQNGTVSQSEAKSLDTSISGRQSGKSAVNAAAGNDTGTGIEDASGNKLKRSARSRLKNSGR